MPPLRHVCTQEEKQDGGKGYITNTPLEAKATVSEYGNCKNLCGQLPKTGIWHNVDGGTGKVWERYGLSGRKVGGKVKTMPLFVKTKALFIKTKTLFIKTKALFYIFSRPHINS